MDQVRIGRVIAALRKRKGLTQEELGKKLGVTNKTVSRWENGNYMPDVEMLRLLSLEFDVSIDELLSADTLSEKDKCKSVEKKAVSESDADAFSLKEKKAYYKKKWQREHSSLFIVLVLIFAASVALPLAFDRAELLGLTPLVAVAEYGYQNNKMMIYVEKKLYS